MIDKRILRFIAGHHVMTLATCGGGGAAGEGESGSGGNENGGGSNESDGGGNESGCELHCCNLFYAFDGEKFIVSSSPETLHARHAAAQGKVAGSIVLETKLIGKLQGVQFRGVMSLPATENMADARKTYLKRFPFAAVMELDLWTIEPLWIKFTDNTLGFGKKLIWEKDK